jgi:hypothetical protein
MNPRRGRGRSGGGGGGGGNRRSQHSPNRSYDSNGPNVRIRGTAAQVYDKYCALARDANSAGDRISAESYLQHAEHYFRIMNANGSGQQQKGQQQQSNKDQQENETEEVPGTGPQPTIAEGATQNTDGNEQAADSDKQRKPRNRNRRKPEAKSESGGDDGENDAAANATGLEETGAAAD